MKTSALAIAGALAASQATPQEAGRPLLTFNFAQSLELSDNPDFIEDPTGTTLSSRTQLGFTLSAATAVDQISLSAGTSLLYQLATNSDDPFDDGFENPFVELDYAREGKSARLSFSASYRKADVGDLRVVERPDETDLILDDGDVERYNLSLGIETGIDAPLGFSLDAAYGRRVYSQTTDPDLVDDETLSVEARLRFAIDRATDLSLVGRYALNQELEGSDYERETRALGFELSRDLSETQRVSLEITSDIIDTFENGTTERNEGYSFAATYSQDLRRGSFSLAATSQLENIGTRNTLRFDRAVELPDGELTFFAGVTNNDTSDLNPIFGASYTREFRRSSVSASAEQIVRQASTSDDEFRDRVIQVSYTQAINSVSDWTAALTYADADNLTDGTETIRTDFEISYSRALPSDWRLVSGYRYEESKSTGDPDRTANTIFLTLQKDFAVRP